MTFFVPDTSPIFSYLPCVDCDDQSTWISAYKVGGNGYDVTFHQAGSINSTIAFNISASSFIFSTGGDTSTSCGAEISINGSAYTANCDSGKLGQGIHQVQVRSANENSGMQFYGISGELDLPKGSYENTTIDDTASTFTYSGSWTQITQSGVAGENGNGIGNETLVGEYQSNLEGFYNQTVSVGMSTDSSVDLKFQGSGIYLFGMSGPNGGGALVSLNGQTVGSLNLSNPWHAYSSLLFMQAGLDPLATHTVSILSTQPGSELVIDYALLTSKKPSSDPSLPVLIGSIGGTALGLLILGSAIYIYFVRRQSSRSRHHTYSTSKSSTIDTWRKTAAPKHISPDTPLTTSVSGSGSAGSRSSRHLATTMFDNNLRSPPPEYPDYLPYRGPIEQPPPAITGSTPHAASWLKVATKTRVPSLKVATETRIPSIKVAPKSALPSLNVATNVHSSSSLEPRPSPSPLRSGISETNDSSYPPRTASTDTSLSPSIAHAHVAKRAVARLWPTRDAVPWSLLQPGEEDPGSIPDPAVASTTTQLELSGLQDLSNHSQLPNLSNHSGLPDVSTHSGLQDLSTHSAIQDQSINASSLVVPVSGPRSPTQTTTPTPSLRRGVSVKSAKTMRSFFSSFFSNTNTNFSTPIPEPPPALPLQAARPDSGLFPNTAPVPLVTSTSASGLRLDLGGGIQNWFIELNPNSPVTTFTPSRPTTGHYGSNTISRPVTMRDGGDTELREKSKGGEHGWVERHGKARSPRTGYI
ncbi:hypothetical protein BCR39DRAFT_558675 [Naematelia encephala]|uniref:Uncharacterized protein n=1 Tax=Naematelia encephala TaxID=71784 RepID=A0A1Y2B6T9_9TREE|nr:hypothetical protein BCR39DRAFT_558675 [Naematelia encephala]